MMRTGVMSATIHGLSAVGGAAAAGLAAVAAFSSEPLDLLRGLNPAALAVASVPLLWLHLLSARGYRRLPFWVASVSGTALILAAVSVRGIPYAPVHEGIAIVTGLIAFGFARLVMVLRFVSARRFVAGFAAFAVAALVLPALTPWGTAAGRDRLVYDRELEAGFQRFSVVERERRQYAEEVERLRRALEELDSPALSAADLEMVSGYDEAVRPGVPLVRDFAVRLASEHPGPFHRRSGSPVPSREGIVQALTIHRYVASEWKYVNDPVFAVGNYFSPADRTIALGLAGDCDDFATVIASSVEAIGGRARIVHGTCDVGAHAWAELFIGDAAAWREALAILSERYPDRTIESIRPNGPNDHWLPLDWQVGLFTCGTSPRVQYVTR
ncbi:MAG: hypothetical protein EA426_20120 [Spirochaetaceae bacterium]|nr:MAG: hypothetical protein EA426_20120 [Spirochaetaceae bacterium]